MMKITSATAIYTYLLRRKRELTEHEILFHGTTLSSMKEIMNNQVFIPQKRKGSDALNEGYLKEHYLGYVFFTDDEQNAGHYSTLACFNTGEYENQNLQTIVGAIIPKQDLLPDLCDAPKARDWKESLVRIGSVSVKGELHLPKENLFLLFTDYDTGLPLYLTTDLNVEKAFKKSREILKEFYLRREKKHGNRLSFSEYQKNRNAIIL